MLFKISMRLVTNVMMEPVAKRRAADCCLGQLDWKVELPDDNHRIVTAVFSRLSKYESKLVLAGIEQLRKLQGVSVVGVDVAVSERDLDVYEAQKLLSSIRLLMPRLREKNIVNAGAVSYLLH
jgi:hypothetical protein